VNLAQERALNKACLKPACFIIWLQFGLPISVDLTFGAGTQSTPHIKTKLKKAEDGPQTPIQDLMKMAFKVFNA
jgi:hypothetical protein